MGAAAGEHAREGTQRFMALPFFCDGIRLRTRGSRHGFIRRMVSPGDLGEAIKPFVFLDRIEVRASGPMQMGWHPHSGIATVSYLFEGAASYEESNGSQGVIPAGGVEWMRAGNGVWHTGGSAGAGTLRGYQLWVALPAALAKGDEVVTGGGILGKVTKVGEQYVSIEVADGVELQVQRGAVVQVLPKGTFK